jgi:hypothetical protein
LAVHHFIKGLLIVLEIHLLEKKHRLGFYFGGFNVILFISLFDTGFNQT